MASPDHGGVAPPLSAQVSRAAHTPVPGEATAVYERAGPLVVRLASCATDVEQAQQLRFSIFFEDGRAIATPTSSQSRRDLCAFDEFCDHLLVFDTDAPAAGGVQKLVGTYRLLRRDVAERHGGFYSQAEFNVAPLLARHADLRFLELGRSCVHPDYRSKRVIELLWRGLWLYAVRNRIDALMGCASLPGTDLVANLSALSFLHHHALALPEWQVDPWPGCAATYAPMPFGAEFKRGLPVLPPLIKAYLRTGARFSGGAAIDREFGTTDVFTVLPLADIEARYIIHYGNGFAFRGRPPHNSDDDPRAERHFRSAEA